MTDDTPQITSAFIPPVAGPPLMRPLFTGAPHLGSLPEVTPQRAQASDDDDDFDDDDDYANDERDSQPANLPVPAGASPLLNGDLTIAEIRANVGDNVPAADAEVERILHFAVRVENIKDNVLRESPAVAGSVSAEYRGAASEFNVERNAPPRSLPPDAYPTPGRVQELRAALARLDAVFTRAAAAIPSPTATDRRTGIIENFNQLLMLLRADMFRLVRLHRAGDDTSWVQGTLLNETRDLVVAQLAAADHIVVHTGPIQTPMYRNDPDFINFTDGFDLLLPMTASQPDRLWVLALNPLRSARGGFIHPNVSGFALCFGDGYAAALNALRRGDLLSYFTVVKTVLSSFSGSPHHDASDWDRSRLQCAECNQRVVAGGVGNAALFARDGFNYHLGCTTPVDGPHGEERLPLRSTITSLFSGIRFHPNLAHRVTVGGSTYVISSTERPAFEEVQRHARAGSYVCPRCETVHPPGAAGVIVDVRRGLGGMLGCPVCTRIDGSDRYIDPRTNEVFAYTVTPLIRRLLRPAAVVVPVACPSCAALVQPTQLQIVRHATTGDEAKTCALCDPFKLGIRCVEANLPEINAVTSRLVRAFADNLLIQHITISQPTNVLQASGLAQVVSRLWLATDISRLFTEPTITFASKLGVWQVFMSSHNESFSSFPLFTATPEQIAQHDHNATALFNATYGSNIPNPNPTYERLWIAYDPGAPVADPSGAVVSVDHAPAPVSAGPSNGPAVGTFGGGAPEVQPANTPEPDILTQLRTGRVGDFVWVPDAPGASNATFGAPVAPVAPEPFGG